LQSIINERRRKRSNKHRVPFVMALETGFSVLAKLEPANEKPNWAYEILPTLIINWCNTNKSRGGNSVAHTSNHIIKDTVGYFEVAESS
jgi:hypothetical protein